MYRKVHPVINLGADPLRGRHHPGPEFPVFDCDFGRLGIQICFDMVYDDGWAALARKGADLVVWPTQSPAWRSPPKGSRQPLLHRLQHLQEQRFDLRADRSHRWPGQAAGADPGTRSSTLATVAALVGDHCGTGRR